MAMQALRAQIEAYQPREESEEHARAVFLLAIDDQGDALLGRTDPWHLTSSGLIFNEARSRVLLIHHRIFEAWGWTGGHLDGESDLLEVALREAREETGLNKVWSLSTKILTLDVLSVPQHIKHGHMVAAHQHLSVGFALCANESAPLCHRAEENTGAAWFDISQIQDVCNEAHMLPIYQRIIARVHACFADESETIQ